MHRCGWIYMYLCCGRVCYVCANGWAFIHVSQQMHVLVCVFDCVSEFFLMSSLKFMGSASPIHTYRAPSSAHQEKAHRPQQHSLNCHQQCQWLILTFTKPVSRTALERSRRIVLSGVGNKLTENSAQDPTPRKLLNDMK